MPFVTFTVRRGLTAAEKSRLSEAMLEAQVAGTPTRLLETLSGLPRELSSDPVKSDIAPLNL